MCIRDRHDGLPVTMMNMACVGAAATAYVLFVGGELNGPTIGRIFTICGFGAFGKHLKNIAPVILGVIVSSIFTVWTLDEPNTLLAACLLYTSIVESIAIYLSRENLTIYKAYDGLQALDIVAAHTIHLILMDIMMPKMDGIKAMLKLRERNNIPIILVSAKGEDADKVFGLEFGADDYITKPFNRCV